MNVVSIRVGLIYTILLLFGKCENYKFSEDQPSYLNSVVAIVYKGKPLCTGVFINPDMVLSAANAFERHEFGKKESAKAPSSLQIYGVQGAFTRHRTIAVKTVLGNQCLRQNVPTHIIGRNEKLNTVHDIIILRTIQKVGHPNMKRKNVFTLFVLPRFGPYTKFPDYYYLRYRFAGFGFRDKEDVRDSKILRIYTYDYDQVSVDCTEHLLPSYGYFRCLRNEDNLLGITQGSPLFLDDELVGIGAFQIKRRESILVFTDLTLYGTSPFHFD